MIMKKFIALLLALVMVMSFAACGDDSETPAGNEGNKEPQTIADITGETFNAGNVSALVPEGWIAFAVSDIFAEEENATDPNKINICKGGSSEFDLFAKPYMQVIYYDPSITMMTPAKDFYDDVKDVAPITAGDLTWNCFTADSMGTAIAVLWTTTADGHQFQINCFLENGGEKIELTDLDFLAILASIKPAK